LFNISLVYLQGCYLPPFFGYNSSLANSLSIIIFVFLQCFDTVGWVIWPVKTRRRYDL